jgi:hypothetical protein
MAEMRYCYESSRGFVHVFKHGARTCNCGEKIVRAYKSPYSHRKDEEKSKKRGG